MSVGSGLPHMWGIVWGDASGKPEQLMHRHVHRKGHRDLKGFSFPLLPLCTLRPNEFCQSRRWVTPSAQTAAVSCLDQPQFDGPLDGRTAAVDVELAVDTLGVCANRA